MSTHGSQYTVEVREPSPDDYRRASQKPQTKNEVKGEVKEVPMEYEDIKKLFARAADIKEKEEDEKEFFKREKSIKPPRKGEIVEQQFPPEAKLEKPAELLKEEEEIRKELKIIRYLPESKDVETVSQVVITFNQPMIPLTGVDELKKYPIPVKLEPKIEGEWRWIGTKTVKWKPTHRLPKATEYVVTIPKGVKSDWGCEMKEEFSFKFSTIPLRIKKMVPVNTSSQYTGEYPPVILEFNQRIKKEEVFKNLTYNGHQKIVEITKEELMKIIDEGGVMKKKQPSLYNSYTAALKKAIPNTFVLFRFDEKIQLSTTHRITVQAGTPSAEGPRVTPSNLSSNFRSYGQMRVTNHWPKSNIVPNQSWSVSFSNNIELDEFDEKWISIEPPIEGVRFSPSGSTVSIQGKSKGQTNYIVTLKKEMKDIYGQNLKESTVSFSVGKARQKLYGFFNNQVIVHDRSTSKNPDFSLVSINLKKVHLRVYQAEPWEVHKSFAGSDNWRFQQNMKKTDDLHPDDRVNAGKCVHDEILEIDHKEDELVETILDLTKYLQFPKEQVGQVIVYAEPVKGDWTNGKYRYRPVIKTWVQATNIAVDGFNSYHNSTYFFASSLTEGKPIPECKFSAISIQNKNKPKVGYYKKNEISVIGDKDGTGYLTNPGSSICLIAKKGNDTAFIKNMGTYGGLGGRWLSYVVNDRNLYKPKEKVSIKGICRYISFNKEVKKITLPKKDDEVAYTWYDPRGTKLGEGKVKFNQFGSFFLEITLPDNINLGDGWVQFRYETMNHRHTYKIQEFRTPEFTSRATVENGPYFPNGVAIVEGKAEYFSGGGLSGCDVTWKVTQNDATYYPPNFTFQGYSFQCGYNPVRPVPAPPKQPEVQLKGSTDGSGDHKMCVEFTGNEDVIYKKPTNVVCNLNIQDINRQMMSSSTSFLVHPSSYYVGIKKKKYFARMGDVVPMDLIVTDIDGTIQSGVDIEMEVFLKTWERRGYSWKEKEVRITSCKFISKTESIPVDLKMEKGGTYNFVVRVADPNGNFNYASTSLWVSGGKERGGGSRVQQETAKLIGNKKEFEIGDVAKLLVTSPFSSPAEGLMLLNCNGFVEKQRFTIEEESTVLSVKIRREYVPGCTVHVYLSGLNDRLDESTGRPSAAAPKRPAFAVGTIALPVPPKAQTLQVTATPDKKIMSPGEEGKVTIQIKTDEKASEMKLEETAVSLIIVDEAVLSLTGYSLPKPVPAFCPPNNNYTISSFLRSSVVMKDWNSIQVEAPPIQHCYGGMGGGGGGGLFSSILGGGCDDFCECCRCAECCCDCSCCCLESCDCCKKSKCRRRCCKKKECKKKQGRAKAPGAPPPSEDATSAEDTSVIEVRTDFRPLCIFTHDSVCDKTGKVVIPFKLPDNLTKYRVWVIAHNSGEKCLDMFGLGESAIQSQLPVAIRPSLPRFLNFGDLAHFTVVVQNQTLSEVKVRVAVRMTNLRLTEVKKQGMEVHIPYNQRAELRFPVVTYKCGTARFQIVSSVVGMKFSDAVEKEIPVFTPSTSEAFATYGEMDGDSVVLQSVKAPEAVYNQFGGLSITTSSTALQSLTDAFLYLYNYKFDCVEQISSRMLSINSLQKFLYEFNVPKMPTKKDLEKVMQHGFKKIRGCMRSDGTIGFWSLTSNVNIYLSIYVAHNLIRAKENGYKVDTTLLRRSKSFCMNVDSYFGRYVSWYSEWTKASLRAFALYVLTIYGLNEELTTHEKDKLAKRAKDLYKQKKKYFSHEGLVWLMFCLFVMSKKKEKDKVVKEILKFINQNVNETPETAHFITNYADDGKLVMLHSNRRTDAVILESLCHVDPKNYLIPKIVKGLMAHKKKGRWRSTQENVYILMALKTYFEKFENVVPDFLCRVWLGEEYAGEVKFKGREVDYKQINVPMKALVPDESKIETKQLCLYKKGPGRMYYRLGMDYAPKSFNLPPVDYGFIVERKYEGVTEKDHVKKLKDGTWWFKAGELIKVKLQMTNVARRYHVALVDMLPAGCEVLNPELKGTEKTDTNEKNKYSSRRGGNYSPYRWCWYYCYWPWYEHVNLRDERVEAFASYLYCGTHDYEYVMRATTLGKFVVPPAKAEEMYSPELFGRSKSEIVVIEE